MSGFYNAPAQAVFAALSAACLDEGRVVAAPAQPSALLGTHLLSHAAGQTTTALLTGGGSGHEPFAAGFVGPGLVDACVAGQVFASPTAAAIAALIRHVACSVPHLQGICLVVLNYQGDRLNFSRAVRDVRADPDPVGIPVRMVVVADDASLRHDAEPRGLAGVAFVLKVTGAAIQRGMSFDDVVRVAESASKSVWTIGVALRPATLPGSSESLSGNNRRAGGGTELGLGIHNKPGAHILPISPANAEDFVDQVVNTICELLDEAISENFGHDHPQPKAIAILVNNLGAVSQLSMGVVLRAVSDNIFGDLAKRHILASCKCRRVYMSSGTLVTSLDMNGFSISAMIIHDDETEELLLAETSCRIWPRVFLVTPETYLAAHPREPFKHDAALGAGSGGSSVPGKKEQSLVVKCMVSNDSFMYCRGSCRALPQHIS
jgi:triose/dihydroxyacetone kinase / FAD-AMP lyase (cyclizing)